MDVYSDNDDDDIQHKKRPKLFSHVYASEASQASKQRKETG